MAVNTAKRREKTERILSIGKGVGEPETKQDSYNIDILKAMTWYNINEETKKLRKWATDYVVKNGKKDYVKFMEKAFDVEVKNIGVFARLLTRDQFVSDEHKQFINERLEFLKNKYGVGDIKTVEDKEVKPTNVVSIEDRINQAALKHAGEIDEHIDAFVTTKSTDFSTKRYLLSNQISGAVSKRIGEYYGRLERELGEAVAGKCEQLNEAYGYLTKSQLKKFHEFVKSIINDCNQQVVASKVRAPRARKAKPASVIVAKLKYLKEFEELKLKSIVPTSIVGASELWVYNTKYRRVTVYKADGTLSVRGTSILSYDVNSSETKTLRKPEEFFKGLSLGKRGLNSAMKDIKTKVIKPNGRINEDMILLGAF